MSFSMQTYHPIASNSQILFFIFFYISQSTFYYCITLFLFNFITINPSMFFLHSIIYLVPSISSHSFSLLIPSPRPSMSILSPFLLPPSSPQASFLLSHRSLCHSLIRVHLPHLISFKFKEFLKSFLKFFICYSLTRCSGNTCLT